MAAAMGYVRVSTTMQVQDGVSLEAQRAKIEAWCALHDYPLADLWVDAGVSGAKMQNRPGLQAALQACGSGDVLVVYSLSRLSRSVRDTLDLSDRLTQAGVDLVSLSEKIDTTSAAGKMVFRLLSVMAEFERDQIVERVKFGMAYKKAQHGRVGTIPYGYRLATDGVTLIEDDHEQGIRAVLRQDRHAGFSLRAIVARLHARGVVSRSGQPFQLTQVARLLKD
ncbi:MAG: recombinase family protein [Paracoccaceae bacterium]